MATMALRRRQSVASIRICMEERDQYLGHCKFSRKHLPISQHLHFAIYHDYSSSSVSLTVVYRQTSIPMDVAKRSLGQPSRTIKYLAKIL